MSLVAAMESLRSENATVLSTFNNLEARHNKVANIKCNAEEELLLEE